MIKKAIKTVKSGTLGLSGTLGAVGGGATAYAAQLATMSAGAKILSAVTAGALGGVSLVSLPVVATAGAGVLLTAGATYAYGKIKQTEGEINIIIPVAEFEDGPQKV